MLEIVWDTPENVAKVHHTLEYVFHGCKCKTGCNSRRCKCKKNETTCRPGCQCIGCSNTPANAASNDQDNELQHLEMDQRPEESDDDFLIEASDKSDDDIDDHMEYMYQDDDDIDNIMQSVFGADSQSESEDDFSDTCIL